MLHRGNVIGSIVVATVVGGVVSGGAIRIGLPLSICVSIGVAVAAIVVSLPWSWLDRRFSGRGKGVRARVVAALAQGVITGSAFLGMSGLHVDLPTLLGLQGLVLAVGYASFALGAAVALLNVDDGTDDPGPTTLGI